MAFLQSAPELGNQYDQDVLLREYLARALEPEVLRAIDRELREMGELAGGDLYRSSLEARRDEPELVQFDGWGRRVDRIRVPEAWLRLSRFAAERGLVAIPYERRHGRFSRAHQFALVYLFAPSSLVYTCPLAMTDGAARTLETHRPEPIFARAFPRLTSRDPSQAWTSGQWMTERRGGSDVAQTETVARLEDGVWRLYGDKWFTSATTAEMALTLARPAGNPPGGKGLALFYLELRDPGGAWNGITVRRLKEKLGTRALPTAELELGGARAEPIAGLEHGIRAIVPMLQMTRTWNAVCSVASMRRGLALARDYAGRRSAFGALLAQKPLHVDTLATLSAEFEAAFLLTFRAVELLGKAEAREASEAERLVLRALQPLVKLFTAKLAVAHASEVLESFGGAGYIEDTGLPSLLRDAQVLSIWEGTTNVLALDAERALADRDAVRAFSAEIERLAHSVRDPALREPSAAALGAAERALEWFRQAGPDANALEARARVFALCLARALAILLVCEHAEWLLSRCGDPRGARVASRLARTPFEIPSGEHSLEDARSIAFPALSSLR